ncbi:hypothetical protein BH23THE1_BH23THE1_32770 [soil metagenome]
MIPFSQFIPQNHKCVNQYPGMKSKLLLISQVSISLLFDLKPSPVQQIMVDAENLQEPKSETGFCRTNLEGG